MSEYINSQLFHVSVTDRLRIVRGMGLFRIGNKTYIDPKVSPKHHIFSNSEPEKLFLRLSDVDPPGIEHRPYSQETVEEASLNRTILAGLKKSTELLRFRLHEPVKKSLGSLALVGVSNLDPISFRAIRDYESGVRILQNTYFDMHHDEVATSLAVIPEGKSIFVTFDNGAYSSNYRTFGLRYNPDNESGLVVWHEDDNFQPNPPPPGPQPPGDFSGDREPRRPRPNNPSEQLELIL